MLTGLLLLVVTALLWVMQGSVVSNAAEKKLNISFIQMMMGLFVMICILPLKFFVEIAVNPVTVIALIFAGIFNCMAFKLLNKAMQIGPNGLTWAIAQSAFAVPFLMGIFFFKVPCSVIRGTGLALLIISMVLMGLSGKNDNNIKGSKSKWIFFSLLAYVVIGLSQCGGNLPSYFIEDSVADIYNLLFRSALVATGFFIGALVNVLAFDRGNFTAKGTVKEIIVLIFSTVMASVCMFCALDMLVKKSAGAIGYPIVTGLSIVFFMIYTAFTLKERPTWQSIGSVFICLAGIAALMF